METDELRKVLDDAPDGPWLLSEQTLYTLRPTKWAGLDTFENAWQAQFSQDGQYKTPLTEVMAAARLCQMAPDLAAEVLRLRAENERLTEALTPSCYTKAAYMGEIHCDCPTENWKHFVPWTSIKEIMAMIRARAALKAKGTE